MKICLLRIYAYLTYKFPPLTAPRYLKMATATCFKWSPTIIVLIILLTSLSFLHNQFLYHLTVHYDRVKIKKTAELPLRFNFAGTFKILQVADMHYGQGVLTRCQDVSPEEFKFCSDLNTTRFLQRLIQVEKPDFLAFTGKYFHLLESFCPTLLNSILYVQNEINEYMLQT